MAQNDQLDLARVLLARAVDDETLVRKVQSDTDVADAIVGFHAQQAAEKLISPRQEQAAKMTDNGDRGTKIEHRHDVAAHP